MGADLNRYRYFDRADLEWEFTGAVNYYISILEQKGHDPVSAAIIATDNLLELSDVVYHRAFAPVHTHWIVGVNVPNPVLSYSVDVCMN